LHRPASAGVAPTSVSGYCTDQRQRVLHRPASAGIAPTSASGYGTDQRERVLHRPAPAGMAPTSVSGYCTDERQRVWHRPASAGIAPASVSGYCTDQRKRCQRRSKIRQFRRLKIRQIGEGTSLSSSRPPDGCGVVAASRRRDRASYAAPAKARCAAASDNCCRGSSRCDSDGPGDRSARRP
jgi:hypothetical protein